MGPVSQEEINLPLFRMFQRSWFMHDQEVPGAGLNIVCLLENVCGCVATGYSENEHLNG